MNCLNKTTVYFLTLLCVAVIITPVEGSTQETIPPNSADQEGYVLSVILEPNAVSSPYTLTECDSVLDNCSEKLKDYIGQPIFYKLIGGSATFMDGTKKSTAIFNGNLEVPAIIAGSIGEQSILVLSDNKSNQYDAIRVATVPSGNISKLTNLLGINSNYFLLADIKFAIVNEDLIENSSNAPQQAFKSSNARAAVSGLCVRVPWGPGVVKWSFSTPKTYGYSVAPESSNKLIWARDSSQNVDAIYKKSWGCGTALKIPDSCTVTVVSSNGSFNTCCNGAMMLLGHTVRWIKTMDSSVDGKYFPDCPLQ